MVLHSYCQKELEELQMKKLSKQFVALLLAFLMIITIIPAYASNKPDAQTKENITYKANNALGEALTSASNELAVKSEYYIQDIQISDEIAEVEFVAPDNATLVVALYDEDSKKMLTSAKTVVNSEDKTTTLSFEDINLPEYYLIKGFLLDEDYKPICENYEDYAYTKAYQEFLDKTVDDFDPAYVVSLDGSYDNNFAVLADDVIITSQTYSEISNVETLNTAALENNLTTNDYDNGIYVFENANDNLLSLKPNDVFYHIYGDGINDYILAKVGTIKTEGTTVTITTAEKFEISDFFKYIKIDTMKNNLSTQSINSRAISGEISGGISEEIKEEIKIKEEGTISFSGKLAIKIDFKFYFDFISFRKYYYEISQKTTASFTGNITMEVFKEWDTPVVELFEGGIPLLGGAIIAQTTLAIDFGVSAKLYISGEAEILIVNGAEKVSGKPKKDLSSGPDVVLKVEGGGEFEITLTPIVEIGFKILYLFEVDVGFEAPIACIANFKVIDVNTTQLHPCTICCDGDIKMNIIGYIKVDFTLSKKDRNTLLNFEFLNVEFKFGDFYISINKNKEGIVKSIKFGSGTCPNIKEFATETDARLSVMSVSTPLAVNAVPVSTDTKNTNKTIYNTVQGYYYIIMVVKDKDARDLLNSNNLLFIDQKTADGTSLAFNAFVPESESEYDYIITTNAPDEPSTEPDEEPKECFFIKIINYIINALKWIFDFIVNTFCYF